jgi:hypothetical protein
MNSHRSTSEQLVRARHRAARALPPLCVLALGLAVTLLVLWLVHPSLMPVAKWKPLGPGWGAAVLMTLLAAAVCAIRRRRSLLRSAAEVDAACGTQNRLEAATALRNAQDALSQAQRAETEQFLSVSHLAPRRRHLAALTMLTAVLAIGHLATLACWTRPIANVQKPVAQTAAIQKEKKPLAPTALIEWKSPEAEAAATAIEEVPLEARVDSSTGLREAKLEIEINGEHRLTQTVTDDLGSPGPHSLKLSIYLDQLGVKTYDIVSYHLSAQRIASGSLPLTVSPVQFVQIKPMREDTFVCAGGDKPSKCFNYVTALKAAQLLVLKENFALAHAEIDKESEEWRQENSRVSDEQVQLAGRTAETLSLMTSNHYPEAILSLVSQSQPLMSEAGRKIGRQENEPALVPQGKALSYLTEVERYLKSSMTLAGKSKQAKARDPFQKPKHLDLKTHPLTPAGKIDELAKEQAGLAGDLARASTNSAASASSDAHKADSQSVAGNPAERQADIQRRMEEFLDDPAFGSEALKHLQSSDDLAGKAQEQLQNHDVAAACEPAAEAARELRQVAAALRADDGQVTKNNLADALLKLSAAAGGARKAAGALSDAEAAASLRNSEQAVREAARRLEEEARRQQAGGATDASARLSELAKRLQGEALKQMQAQAQQQPRGSGRSEALARRLDELAEQAAQVRSGGQSSPQELARLVERMERTEANLNNFASQCSASSSEACRSTSPGRSQSASSSAQPGSPGANASGQNGQPGESGSQAPSAEMDSHALAREPGAAEQRRLFAENLMQQLQEETMDAMGARPDAAELRQVREVLEHESILNEGNVVAFCGRMDPPLKGLIAQLRQELAHSRRQYKLTDQQVAQAPRAYRPAVADYFERLSRDYTAGSTVDQARHP